jgi:hypothetical protein
LTATLSEKLTYISQTDVLYTRNDAGAVERNTYGNINYLIYKLNDCVSIGNRFEYFNFDGAYFNATNANPNNARNNNNLNYTTGINYRHNANLLFRPEVRWVWDRERFGFNEQNASSQASFGGDMVLTF